MYLNCIIIDSDRVIHHILANSLNEHFPEIKNIKSVYSGSEGIALLNQNEPDIIFIGDEMTDMSGAEMLTQLGDLARFDTQIIFLSSNKIQKINSIKHHAIDYLSKPIDQEELERVVELFLENRKKDLASAKLINASESGEILNLKLQEGELLIPIKDILFLQGDRNYTYIYSKAYGKTLVSKTLSHFETNVDFDSFFRCHKSFIVNRAYIKTYLPNNLILLTNDIEIPVARRKKTNFMSWFGSPVSE